MRLLPALVLAGLVGCSAPGREPGQLILWHTYSGTERSTLEGVVRRFHQAQDEHQIKLVYVPFDAFPDKIAAAIPNGNGPDLFVFAHDRIGDWAEAGLIEPVEFFVDEKLASRFDLQPISAMAYRGSLYGLPLSVKSLALFYRTDLVESPPRTTDELLALGREHTEAKKGRFGLVYENRKLYGNAAWLHGFRGRLFDDGGRPSIATSEAVHAMTFVKELASIVPKETTNNLVGTLFNEGRAPLAISGPWFVGNVDESVPWKVTTLPVVSATGKPAAPFLGAEGVMMSSRARDKLAAFRVMDFLTGDESALVRAVEARQVVPNAAVYRDERVRGDQVLAAFREQSEVAVPMPSIPEMRLVWTPYDQAFEKVLAQGVEPAAALAGAEREILGYLRGSTP